MSTDPRNRNWILAHYTVDRDAHDILVEALEAMFYAFEGACTGKKAQALHKASQALDIAKGEV